MILEAFSGGGGETDVSRAVGPDHAGKVDGSTHREFIIDVDGEQGRVEVNADVMGASVFQADLGPVVDGEAGRGPGHLVGVAVGADGDGVAGAILFVLEGVEENGEAVGDRGPVFDALTVAKAEATGGSAAGDGLGAIVLDHEGEAIGAPAHALTVGNLEGEDGFKAVADGYLGGAPNGTADEAAGRRQAKDGTAGLGVADKAEFGDGGEVLIGRLSREVAGERQEREEAGSPFHFTIIRRRARIGSFELEGDGMDLVEFGEGRGLKGMMHLTDDGLGHLARACGVTGEAGVERDVEVNGFDSSAQIPANLDKGRAMFAEEIGGIEAGDGPVQAEPLA